MSTRSLIAMKVADNKYETIYCHSDGYLTFNGAMLLDHYNDRDKITKLLKLGNISCLLPNIDPDPSKPHSFDYDKRQEDVVVAYGRDRGEKGQESKVLSMEELKKWDWIEYIYIFDENDKWTFAHYPFDDFIDVQEGLDKEYKEMGIKRPKERYGFWSDDEIEKEKKKQQEADGDEL